MERGSGVRRQKACRVSDVALRQLESMIEDGRVLPGQRLPSERELAGQLGVSRPSLREAIHRLVARGALSVRQRNGIYVCDASGDARPDPLLELFKAAPDTQRDLLALRRVLEGQAAYGAALRSTAADREAIRARYGELQLCHAEKAFEREVAADAAFHLAIATAAHNGVLLHMMQALFGLLRQHIADNLATLYPRSEFHEKIHAQHLVLMDAILAGEPDRARRAAQEHLACLEEALREKARANAVSSQ